MAKKNDLEIKISEHQSDILDGFDLLSTETKVIPKIISKEEKVVYKPIKRDFIKKDCKS